MFDSSLRFCPSVQDDLVAALNCRVPLIAERLQRGPLLVIAVHEPDTPKRIEPLSIFPSIRFHECEGWAPRPEDGQGLTVFGSDYGGITLIEHATSGIMHLLIAVVYPVSVKEMGSNIQDFAPRFEAFMSGLASAAKRVGITGPLDVVAEIHRIESSQSVQRLFRDATVVKLFSGTIAAFDDPAFVSSCDEALWAAASYATQPQDYAGPAVQSGLAWE